MSLPHRSKKDLAESALAHLYYQFKTEKWTLTLYYHVLNLPKTCKDMYFWFPTSKGWIKCSIFLNTFFSYTKGVAYNPDEKPNKEKDRPVTILFVVQTKKLDHFIKK